MNAGKFRHKIKIYNTRVVRDRSGFQTVELIEPPVLEPFAEIKTTRGMTLIINNSDFEKAYTNFTIRYPVSVEITRGMRLKHNNRTYTIEYLNNVDNRNVELEIQAKESMH